MLRDENHFYLLTRNSINFRNGVFVYNDFWVQLAGKWTRPHPAVTMRVCHLKPSSLLALRPTVSTPAERVAVLDLI